MNTIQTPKTSAYQRKASDAYYQRQKELKSDVYLRRAERARAYYAKNKELIKEKRQLKNADEKEKKEAIKMSDKADELRISIMVDKRLKEMATLPPKITIKEPSRQRKSKKLIVFD